MKIFLTLLMLIAVSGSFAQEQIRGKDQNSKHDYYVMEGDYIIHYYTVVKADTIFTDCIFNQGNTLTSGAVLVNKKGKIIFLSEGECVDSKGNIADCSRLKKKLGDETE